MTPEEWAELPSREKIALVQSTWMAGKSARDLARGIGPLISRQSIIGLYRRNKALAISHPLSGKPGGSARSVPKQTAPRPSKPKPEKPSPVAIPPKPIIKRAEPPDFRNMNLLQLESGLCKWPAGERDFTFCGQATGDPLKSYCAHHHRRSYQRPS